MTFSAEQIPIRFAKKNKKAVRIGSDGFIYIFGSIIRFVNLIFRGVRLL